MMATSAEVPSEVRQLIRTYTGCVIIWISTFVLLTALPIFPGGLILPVLLGIGLSLVYLKEPEISLITLYILSYFSIMWELIGFGFFQLLATTIGAVVILALVIPLLTFLTDRLESLAVAVIILSVSLMLTPIYFLSIPLVLVTALFGGFGSSRLLIADFALLFTPLALLNNAIYFVTTPRTNSSPPIIFSQLSYLTSNVRPALSGIAGVPSSYLYSHSLAVTGYLIGRGYTVYLPLVIFGLVLVASSWIAGLTNSLLKRLSAVELTRRFSGILVPILVSVIASGAFVVMMLALSPLGAAVFQTALSYGSASYYLIAGSLAIAGLFVGTELSTQRLERSQLLNTKLENLLVNLDERLGVIGGEVQKIEMDAPSIDLSPEKKTLSETMAYAADVRKQLATASYGSFVGWISDIENRIIPSLDLIPGSLRTRLATGLQVLSSASLTMNSRLEEGRAPGPRYLSMEHLVVGEQALLEEILQLYRQTLDSIEQTTSILFDLYLDSIKAYSTLMLVEEIAPPVSPGTLLASRDYIAAMKLVSEDYWLNFYVRENDRYGEKLRIFLSLVSKVAETAIEGGRGILSNIVEKSASTFPSNAPLMLENMNEVIDFYRETIEKAIDEIETVKKVVSTVDPSFSNVLKLNTTGIFNELMAIQGAVRRVHPNFNDVDGLSKEMLPIFQTLFDDRRADEESLIVISQYPVAVRFLQRLFASKTEVVRTRELPFQHDTAAFFVRSFAESNKSYSYNEQREELSIGHDKMYQRS